MSATDEWVDDSAAQMLGWLHPGHLHDAEQARILRGLLQAAAKTSLPLYNRALAMRDVHDPDRVPGKCLPLLGAQFGLDAAIGFPRHFTEAQWRRFLPDAVAIWRQAGFDLRSILVALLARPVLVADWHLRKDILGLTSLPWYGLSSPGASPWSEYTVDLHLPDPYGIFEDLGGTLSAGEKRANRDLVHGAIAALRPWNERLDVYWYALVEDFSQGLFQWSRMPGVTPATLETAVFRLAFANETGMAMSVGPCSAAWKRVVWTSLLEASAAGDSWWRIRHSSADDNSTVVRVTFHATDSTAGRIRIYDETGGTLTLLSTTATELHLEVQHHLQIASIAGVSTDSVRVTVDGNLIVETASATDHARAGTCSLYVDSGAALDLLYTEVAIHPVAAHRVGPGA